MIAQNELLQRITINPLLCGGRPTIRGMRIRLTDILELLGHGLSAAQILEELPDLESKDIQACLLYVAQRFDHPVIVASSSSSSSPPSPA